MARRDTRALKAAIPIRRVIGAYIPLRGGGRELRGPCPFCVADDGQFSVNSEKSVYHCFECQAGGDTLKFLMQMEHLTFGEAVDRLASLAGVTLSEDGGHYDRQHVERIRMIEVHRAAADFYTTKLNVLPEAGVGRTFLADRGFDKAAAAHFGVGYSPQGWDHLIRHLRSQGFTNKELLHSGLVIEGRRGPIDRFRGRLMWPIRNIGGEVVGFGARKLHDADNGPKYIYTPETAIYKKSQVLYGIDLAKKDIASSLSAVVVEDFTDVMACHLAGVTTAVATCGTIFGSDHVKLLRRLLPDNGSARAIFAFEDNESGQQTALRAIEDNAKFAGEMYIAVAPGNMSPCALRIAKGNEAVADLAQPRTPLFEFALLQIVLRHDLDTPAGRAAALDEAAPLVARIRNSGHRHEVAVQLAGMLNILDEAFVVGRVAQLARAGRSAPNPASGAGQRGQNGTEPTKFAVDLRNPVAAAERELLKLALQRPDVVSPAFDAYGVDEFTSPPYATVRQAILEAGGAEYGVQEQSQYLALVREAAPDQTARALVTELSGEAIMSRTVNETYAGSVLVAVRRRSVARRIQDLLSALAVTNSTDAPTHLAQIQNELWTLYQYDQALQQSGAKAL
ncbi:DNA primase [Streptomyces sp. NPDC091294]|uniref:DNA primase n=1 Tax=Streptomyces sp. NPDC091294 TaxID=3365992 RepID=UPI0038011D1F